MKYYCEILNGFLQFVGHQKQGTSCILKWESIYFSGIIASLHQQRFHWNLREEDAENL